MVSSLIPPKIAVPQMVKGGKGGEPSFYSYVYSRLPKGPMPASVRFANSTGPVRWVNHPSYGGKPYLVVLGVIILGGYTSHYLRHFRYEKNNHH
ncbi:hydrogen-transporting ATP synthase [Mrakia frigida]|uniref:hydrogen-transporting ATP synthase n=1 Tax=Mrakia frigida TaxID=29902 RepID=UPI003FCC1161